ncbi:MAG TPA: CapA family protein [Bacillaceae bacterium]
MSKTFKALGLMTGMISLIGIFAILFIQKQNVSATIHSDAQHGTRNIQLTEKSFVTEAIIGGIGDILIHDWVYEDAKKANGYHFDDMFAPVRQILQKPDFLIANQESPPAGAELGISSYPLFNSPHEIVDALMNAGVDMVTTANNHTLDKGEKGVKSAIGYYEKKGLPYTGSYKSFDDQSDLRIMTVNGIRIAVLAYASHTNGIPIPKGKEYLVNMLDSRKVLNDMKAAKRDADMIVLSLHWGDEYQRTPNETQKTLARQFINGGADIILGHHPHVLQPMEEIKRQDGSSGVVYYSLGNFLSGQLWDYKDVGGMAEIKVRKEFQGGRSNISVVEASFHPTFTSSVRFRDYKVYPLAEASEKGLTTHTSKDIEAFLHSWK